MALNSNSSPGASPNDGRPALILCPELFAAEGGIARISRLYLEALSALMPGGPRLIVLNDARLDPAQLRHHLPGGPVEATACAGSKSRLVRSVLAATRVCPHVLATHVRMLPVLLFARATRPALRWDVVLHGIEAWGRLPPLAALALRRSRRVYCVSEYTRDVVAKLHPSAAPNLRVLHNAVDPGLAAALGRLDPAAAEPGRMLAVSRLAPHDRPKGIDHLILALPEIRKIEPRATLHIVGDGEDRRNLEAIADSTPTRSSVIFHGKLDEPALLDQFARCRLFALPSEKEGFGLVYAEALAAGRPCLAARAGGSPEVVGQEGGMLVPYGDLRAIAQAAGEALQRTWSVETLRARSDLFSATRFIASFKQLWTAP